MAVDNQLLARHAELAEADLDLVRGVREALRALLVQNAGGPSPTDSVLAPLRADRLGGTARACLGDDGEVRVDGDRRLDGATGWLTCL